MDANRQTGRTTAAVEACRKRAEIGKRTVYVSATHAQSRYCIGLFDWTGWEHPDPLRFVHPSGGEVRFMSGTEEDVRRKIRGTRLLVAFDHHFGL